MSANGEHVLIDQYSLNTEMEQVVPELPDVSWPVQVGIDARFKRSVGQSGHFLFGVSVNGKSIRLLKKNCLTRTKSSVLVINSDVSFAESLELVLELD